MTHRLFIFAGEKSGDLHGGHLLDALQQRLPQFKAEGVGGPEMRSRGLECLMPTENFEVMGFSDVVGALPRLIKQFYVVRDHILKSQPEVVLLIDYPGFNLRMARALRKQQFTGKIVQYISPSFWAWGHDRVQKMVNTLDLLLTIYPFEADSFVDTPLDVRYVGNPTQESLSRYPYCDHWKEMLGIKPDHLIAIFPGSRRGELIRNLPDQLEAAHLLKQDNPRLHFAISCAHEKIMPVIHKILKQNPLTLNRDIFLVPKAYSYELMRDSRSAMATSGTVTLELALHRRPTTVTYRLSFLNRLFAQYILRLNLPHYCMVNILSKQRVFPELIAEGVNPKNLYHRVRDLDREGEIRQQCIAGCQHVQDILKSQDTSRQAAKAIEELLA